MRMEKLAEMLILVFPLPQGLQGERGERGARGEKVCTVSFLWERGSGCLGLTALCWFACVCLCVRACLCSECVYSSVRDECVCTCTRIPGEVQSI